MNSLEPISVVMLGATGAVGSQVAKALVRMPQLKSLTLLGRRPLEDMDGDLIRQHTIDVFSPASAVDECVVDDIDVFLSVDPQRGIVAVDEQVVTVDRAHGIPAALVCARPAAAKRRVFEGIGMRRAEDVIFPHNIESVSFGITELVAVLFLSCVVEPTAAHGHAP